MATAPDFEDKEDLEQDAIPIETTSKDDDKGSKAKKSTKKISEDKNYVEGNMPGFHQYFDSRCNVQVMNINASEMKSIHFGNVYNLNGKIGNKKKRKDKPQVDIPKAILESQKVVDEENIDIIRENIVKDWKVLGRKLGLQDTQLDELIHDNHLYGVSEIVYQMMLKWSRENGDNATVGQLAVALQTIKKSKVALKLRID